jgi:hypothetical protein
MRSKGDVLKYAVKQYKQQADTFLRNSPLLVPENPVDKELAFALSGTDKAKVSKVKNFIVFISRVLL